MISILYSVFNEPFVSTLFFATGARILRGRFFFFKNAMTKALWVLYWASLKILKTQKERISFDRDEVVKSLSSIAL